MILTNNYDDLYKIHIHIYYTVALTRTDLDDIMGNSIASAEDRVLRAKGTKSAQTLWATQDWEFK